MVENVIEAVESILLRLLRDGGFSWNGLFYSVRGQTNLFSWAATLT